jgi:hypothetical protein
VDVTSHWIQLQECCEFAAEFPELQVWLFGSALSSPDPADLDVLVIYVDRPNLLLLKAARRWEHFDPPVHIIAMTAKEEEFYDFKATTGAVRLL